MKDEQLIELYFSRNERALEETLTSYGSLLRSLIRRILPLPEDVDECMNETLLKVWNSIPPEKPHHFAAYVSKIARNTALHRYQRENAQKRGGSDIPAVLDELSDLSDGIDHPAEEAIGNDLSDAISRFLKTKKRSDRILFVRRYFYLERVTDIAKVTGTSEAALSSRLFKLRRELRSFLQKEGYMP